LITNSFASTNAPATHFKLIDFAVCSFVGVSVAPVQPVAVPAVTSTSVGSSTLPAAVVLAFGTEPAAISAHAQPTYCWNTHNAVLYANIQFAGLGMPASLAVASAYTGALNIV